MTERATEKLIDGLTVGLAPVRPLQPPVVRALLWLAAAALLIGGFWLCRKSFAIVRDAWNDALTAAGLPGAAR